MSVDRPALTMEERAACAVCADALHASRSLSAGALLAMAAVLLAAWGRTRFGTSPAVLGGLLVLGLAERYLAMRVALDARLFDRLAAADAAGLPGLPLLDVALQQVLRVPADTAGRLLAPRIGGALRLCRLHAAATVLLVALAALAWCLR